MNTRPLTNAELMAFAGITVAPDALSYQLPDDLPLPATFRAEFNAWAAGFFAPKSRLRLGELVDRIPDGCNLRFFHAPTSPLTYVNPRTYRDMLDGKL